MEKKEEYDNFKITIPAEFEEVFSHFYFAENKSSHKIQKTLLPSFQTILIFSFGTRVSFSSQQHTAIRIEKCVVLGPVKQPIEYTLPTGAEILVANFTTDSFYRFFGQAIVSEHVPIHPDKLLNDDCFTNLWYLLNEIPTAQERVNMILDFCRPYLKESDKTIKQLIGFDEKEKALNPIKAIAQESKQSERSIQSKHKKYLGYSAKEINRYKRFLKAIELSEAIFTERRKIDWPEIINECGYYDQSQLIHDFRHFLNLSPTQYMKFQQDICITRPE